MNLFSKFGNRWFAHNVIHFGGKSLIQPMADYVNENGHTSAEQKRCLSVSASR